MKSLKRSTKHWQFELTLLCAIALTYAAYATVCNCYDTYSCGPVVNGCTGIGNGLCTRYCYYTTDGYYAWSIGCNPGSSGVCWTSSTKTDVGERLVVFSCTGTDFRTCSGTVKSRGPLTNATAYLSTCSTPSDGCGS